MMEAYSYSDPTRAEDGLFLNPSETLISNGTFRHESVDAGGFAPGEDPPGFTGDYGTFLGGILPAGNQHSSEDLRPSKASPTDEQTQPVEPQTGEDTGFDLEADFEAVFAELDGEQRQDGDSQSWDVEADLNATFDEILRAEGENQSLDLEADLNAAFDEILPEVSQVEDSVVDVDDDDDGSLFTPEGDDDDNDLDSLFSPDDIDDELLCSDSTKMDAKTTVRPVPNPASSLPSWVASLPSLPKSVENNSTPIPTQPAWQSAHLSQPLVAQINGSTPTSGSVSYTSIRPELTVLVPSAASCQYLLATNPLTPAVPYQGRPTTDPIPPALAVQSQSALNRGPFWSLQPGLTPVAPIVSGQHPAAQTNKIPLTSSSSLQVAHEGVELYKRCLAPGAPYKRSFTPDVPIEPAKKKAKIIILPPSSKIPEFFEMDKQVLRAFEKLAKVFMLDPKHPQRYADGAANVQTFQKDAVPTLARFSKYPAQFLEDGPGEVFFGAKSDGYATRTLKWPEHKDDIADLVLPLLRKICKNEVQRLYAGRNRVKAKESKAQDVANPKLHTNKQPVPSPCDVSQSPTSISSSPSPQSPEQSQPSTRTSTPEFLPNQSVPSSHTRVTSTCVQGQVPPLVSNEDPTQTQCPPSKPPSIVQVNNDQSVAHGSLSTGNKPETQPFVFTFIPFDLPSLRFSINYVLEDKMYVAVRSKVDLAVGVHPSHLSMLRFIYKTIPNDYCFNSLNVHGPSVLRQIQHEDIWNAAVMEISMTPWMGSEVKCIAKLAKKATITSTTSQEVILID